MTAARQRRFVRVVALVVLLGAILPSVTYVGHWTIRGLGHVSATTAASAQDHTNHCHGPSACAHQSAYGLQWWWDSEKTSNLGGDPERAQAPEGSPSPTEPVIAPVDPPPRYA